MRFIKNVRIYDTETATEVFSVTKDDNVSHTLYLSPKGHLSLVVWPDDDQISPRPMLWDEGQTYISLMETGAPEEAYAAAVIMLEEG